MGGSINRVGPICRVNGGECCWVVSRDMGATSGERCIKDVIDSCEQALGPRIEGGGSRVARLEVHLQWQFFVLEI